MKAKLCPLLLTGKNLQHSNEQRLHVNIINMAPTRIRHALDGSARNMFAQPQLDCLPTRNLQPQAVREAKLIITLFCNERSDEFASVHPDALRPQVAVYSSWMAAAELHMCLLNICDGKRKIMTKLTHALFMSSGRSEVGHPMKIIMVEYAITKIIITLHLIEALTVVILITVSRT